MAESQIDTGGYGAGRQHAPDHTERGDQEHPRAEGLVPIEWVLDTPRQASCS